MVGKTDTLWNAAKRSAWIYGHAMKRTRDDVTAHGCGETMLLKFDAMSYTCETTRWGEQTEEG